MRSLIIPVILVIIIYSCSNRSNEKRANHPETPVALQENKKDYSLVSKRYPSQDLLEELYDELEEKNASLIELKKNIADLEDKKLDSTKEFIGFHEKNERYYSAAINHIATVKDSVLKQRLIGMIATSQKNYDASVSNNQRWVAILKEKSFKLDDLYTVLKLVKTLNLIEEYQKNERPGTIPLQSVSAEFDNLMSKTDKLSQEK